MSAADIGVMRPYLILLLTIASLFHGHSCHARYLSAHSGLHLSNHQYLGDEAQLSSPVYGVRFDSTLWRRSEKGWLARGAAIEVSQGQNYLKFQGQVPIFHWHKRNGIWLDYQFHQQTLEATLSESAIFLANNGSATSVAANSNVSVDHQISQLAFYWYEKSRTSSPINFIGGVYQTETSPARSTITGTNASLFDGTFTGFGLTLGRKQDERGLNFQWTLNMTQLDSDFSNDITAHRQASKAESTAYQLGLHLNWHYRYYLAPYWYLVPQLKILFTAATQTAMDPVQLDHDPLIQYQTQTLIHLQKRF